MNTILAFGRLKQIGAVLIAAAIVLAAGTVVGQAPTLFGADVTEDPEASIEFSDQTGNGTSVKIDAVSLSEGGFVVVTADDEVVGVSEYLEADDYDNLTVEQRDDVDLEMLGHLTATVHRDVTDTGEFVAEDEVEEGEDHDRPFTDEGYPVSDTATVTMAERPGGEGGGTSFGVESIDAPSSITTNESLDVLAEVDNPNDFEDRQHVEFRIDGELIERQVLSLSAEETREVEFSIGVDGVSPGEHSFAVLTRDDGEVGEVTIEHAPEVAVLEADNESVRANATLRVDGFLAVTDGDGSTLATSDNLSEGEHEDVSIDLEEPVDDGTELTVVLYEGEVGDENAEPATDNDRRVAETVVVGEDGGGEGSADEASDEGEADDESEADDEDGDGGADDTGADDTGAEDGEDA